MALEMQRKMEEMMKKAADADAEQKKQERAAEKKRKAEEAEAKRKAEEAARKVAAESAKRKAGSSKGKSKEVIVESDDNDSEGPELPKIKKWKLAGGKSKTDETVIEAVVPCFQ